MSDTFTLLVQSVTLGSMSVDNLRATMTVNEAITIYCTEHAQNIEKVAFSFGGKKMDDNKTLADYELGPDNVYNTVLRIALLNGGAQMERVRKLDFKKKWVVKSDKEDCAMLDKALPRAEMDCGHAIGAQSCFDNMRWQIVDKGARVIRCPVPNCQKEWKWLRVACVADLTMDEYLYFNGILEKRNADNMKACPHCDELVIRPDDLTMIRVNCSNCKKADFCFVCGQIWKFGGFQVCGHDKCPTTAINKGLAECKTVCPSIVPKDSVQMPEIRACPKCFCLINYTNACKHMTCECGHQFCFVCLSQWDEDNSRCPTGSYDVVCPVAPRQQLK